MESNTVSVGELKDFLDLLSELKGVVEVKVLTEEEDAWIGMRVIRRPPQVLLQQVSRAAVGFGLDPRNIHFGILAD